MEGSVTAQCPECETKNPPSTKFCEACGCRLDVGKPQKSAAATRRTRAKTVDKSQRIEIERKLRKARGVLKSMRLLYAVLGIASLLFFASMMLFELPDGELGDVLNVARVILGVQAALLIVGAIFLYAQPLFFSLSMACVLTVGVLIQSWIAWQAQDLSLQLVLNIFVVVCLWCAVPIIARVASLQREHPDLIDTSALKSRQRFVEAPTGAALARAELKRATERRARLRTVGIVAGAILLSVLAYFPIRAAMRDAPEVEEVKAYTTSEIAAIEAKLMPAVYGFAARWTANDRQAVHDMFTADRQRTFWPEIERFLKRYDWFDDLPKLSGDPVQKPGSLDSQDVWFSLLPKGTLKTRWTWQDERWQLHRLSAADLR